MSGHPRANGRRVGLVERPWSQTRECLTAEQRRALIRAATDTRLIAITLALAFGMRPDEIVALKCSDVDFERGGPRVLRRNRREK
jgi:integrase